MTDAWGWVFEEGLVPFLVVGRPLRVAEEGGLVAEDGDVREVAHEEFVLVGAEEAEREAEEAVDGFDAAVVGVELFPGGLGGGDSSLHQIVCAGELREGG